MQPLRQGLTGYVFVWLCTRKQIGRALVFPDRFRLLDERDEVWSKWTRFIFMNSAGIVIASSLIQSRRIETTSPGLSSVAREK